MNQVADLFERSATALLQGEGPSEARNDVRALIQALGYDDGDAVLSRHRGALLRAAAKLKRVFQLEAPDAPGLIFFGGEADPSFLAQTPADCRIGGLSGSGLSMRKAFESCIGEGIEYLSQFQLDEAGLDYGTIAERMPAMHPRSRDFIAALAQCRAIPFDRDLAWVSAIRLSDGTSAQLPADICLRRLSGDQDFSAPFKLSTGCAAGVSFESAALHGVLELIERDAASLWWRGGRRGRAVCLESDAGRAAADLIARLRKGERRRVSWLLDITTDIGVPCAAAISCRTDGFGFAFGLAARATMAAAVRSAIFEMCQSELAHEVVEAKRREGGEAALNDGDLRHLRRETMIDCGTCRLLHPVGLPATPLDEAEESPTQTLRMIVDRLTGMGIETFAVDLTRPIFAVPVVRIVAPGLQLEPSEIAIERLANAIAEFGGGGVHTGEVALL
jgi:ribosomal protein S12 methylthiotransferase accessory factor